MAALTTRPLDDRFVLDDPTDEDAPKLTLVVEADDEVELDPEDQARLDALLDRGLAQVARGETVSAEEFLAKLRARRQR